MAALGLYCYAWAFSSCREQGYSLQASHFHAFSCYGAQAFGCMVFSSCGSWAYLPHGMWNLPRPGIELVAPALAGRFLNIGPPGK